MDLVIREENDWRILDEVNACLKEMWGFDAANVHVTPDAMYVSYHGAKRLVLYCTRSKKKRIIKKIMKRQGFIYMKGE